MIKEFRGSHYFLSNFSDSSIELDGVKYLNGEAAFRIFKDLSRRSDFARLDPSGAKRLGRSVRLRKDWETVKDGIMLMVVRAKFTQNKDLKAKLLATGTERLEEGNTWNDTYWGVCRGAGKNKLGEILMQVRKEFAEQ